MLCTSFCIRGSTGVKLCTNTPRPNMLSNIRYTTPGPIWRQTHVMNTTLVFTVTCFDQNYGLQFSYIIPWIIDWKICMHGHSRKKHVPFRVNVYSFNSNERMTRLNLLGILTSRCHNSTAPVYLIELLIVYKSTHQLLRSSSGRQFSVFPLCACIRLVRDLFFILHCLSGTVFLAKLDHQTHIRITFEISPFQAILLTLCVCVCVCVVCVCDHRSLFWLCFVHCLVMGYVLKFGEIAHERVHYYS